MSDGSESRGTVLHEAGQMISTVYFPLSSIVSTVADLPSGDVIETGIIGRERYVGGYFSPRGWHALGHGDAAIADIMQNPQRTAPPRCTNCLDLAQCDLRLDLLALHLTQIDKGISPATSTVAR